MNRAWLHRIDQERRAGNLTPTASIVLRELAFYAHAGEAWPSHQTLAERAGCSIRSVQRALQSARERGLISWIERRIRVGWRWLRTSNVYRLLMPPTTGQNVRRETRVKEKEAAKRAIGRLAEILRAPVRLPNLAEIRRAREQRLGFA